MQLWPLGALKVKVTCFAPLVAMAMLLLHVKTLPSGRGRELKGYFFLAREI